METSAATQPCSEVPSSCALGRVPPCFTRTVFLPSTYQSKSYSFFKAQGKCHLLHQFLWVGNDHLLWIPLALLENKCVNFQILVISYYTHMHMSIYITEGVLTDMISMD